MDDDYYRLILSCRIMSGDLPIVTAGALIPLKSLKADLGTAMPRPQDLLTVLESYFSLTRRP